MECMNHIWVPFWSAYYNGVAFKCKHCGKVIRNHPFDEVL